MCLIATKLNGRWLEWSLSNVSWNNECHHSKTSMNLSCTSAVCARQNSAVLGHSVPSDYINSGNYQGFGSNHSWGQKGNSPQLIATIPWFGKSLYLFWAQPWWGFLGGTGGFQALLAVFMYPRWQRTGLVPCVFPVLNLHRGANPTGKQSSWGKQQFSCSLQKRGRFSDRALAAKPSFVLPVRKLLPGVWSAHFSKRALAKCGIKGILIVIIASTCPLKYNSKYHLKPQPQSGNGVCFWSNATTWAVSVTSWGLFCMRHSSDVEVKCWHPIP